MGVETAACIAVLVVAAIVILWRAGKGGPPRNGNKARPRSSEAFWTRYGGAVDEQVRRVDAAEKGEPDEPWAEAYWPPGCL